MASGEEGGRRSSERAKEKCSSARWGKVEEGARGLPLRILADIRYFAAEIIGNILNLEARKWLRPRKLDSSMNKERARALGTKFQPYNWTLELQEGA